MINTLYRGNARVFWGSLLCWKCDKCQHGLKRKLPDLPTAAKSQQSSLSFYFTKKTKTPVPTTETPVNTQQQLHYDCNPSRALTETRDRPSTAVTSTPSAKKTRALTVAAANRWKTTSLAEQLGSEWLVISMVLTLGEHIGIDRVAPISSTTLERNSVKD